MSQPNVLHQVAGHWQKLFSIMLWKLAQEQRITITADDIKTFQATYDAEGGPAVVTFGSGDNLSFQIMSQTAAQTAALLYQAQTGGSA